MNPSKPLNPSKPRHRLRRSEDKGLSRIAGWPAVAALFAAAPARVERLFFDARAKPKVSSFCAELARAHKPFRQVEADELAHIAGTPMHGGIVAVARPQPVRPFDIEQAR